MSKKDKINEPAETYEVNQKNDETSEELHPILVALLDKSIEDARLGKGVPHEEVMKRVKEKYPFLK